MNKQKDISPSKAYEMQIYTTGAFLRPIKKAGIWIWKVIEFSDDSFKDGVCINPVEFSSKLKNILRS
jgi:hypothetical protein